MRGFVLCWVLAELLLIGVVWARIAKPNGLSRSTVIWLLLGAAVLAAPARLLQGFLLDSLEISASVTASGTRGALFAALGVMAPIEQAALVLVVWPIHRAFRLHSLGAAIAAGILVALGYSIIDGGWMLFTETGWLTLARILVRSAHTVGGCMLWAAVASYDQSHRKHWFAPAWFLAVGVQGFGNHVALGRGPGFGVAALPLLLVIFGGAVSVLRNKSKSTSIGDSDASIDDDLGTDGNIRLSRLPRFIESIPAMRRLSRVSLLPERPTIHQIRVAWKHQHRPALLHWIAAGALTCLGALFVSIAISVVTSHWFGMDLSRLDDSDVSATGPLLFMGIFVLGAFLVAGYLVALASAADSVFEPGMGAIVAIVIVVALLAIATPAAVIFALAIAPLAFGLACVGAWFGLQR
jgi:hypothetical protein